MSHLRRARPAWFLALALVAAGSAGAADALYVVEQVVVSLNASADGNGERIASLKSGDRVELLERSGESVHVRLPDGREGWLRAIYVSGDEPMRPRLLQSEAEVTRLRAELSRLQAQAAAAASASPAAGAAAAAPAATVPAEESATTAGGLFNTADAAPQRQWPWVLTAAVVGLLLGFALGWRMLAGSIRKKYGGLKIY